jgi:hypothetical protein
MTNEQAKPQSSRARTDWPLRALIGVWLVAAAIGWCYVERYEFATNPPGTHGVVDHWPADSSLPHTLNRPTLVLFLHPKCPCSRASLKELDRLLTPDALAKTPAPELLVVATVPANVDETWWSTGTVEQSRQLTNSKLFIDRDGREAERFGATTSGMLMFFDAAGVRRYAGGITVSRGHEGHSAGSDIVTALVRGEAVERSQLPVFGCRLCLPESTADREIAKRDVEHISQIEPAI